MFPDLREPATGAFALFATDVSVDVDVKGGRCAYAAKAGHTDGPACRVATTRPRSPI